MNFKIEEIIDLTREAGEKILQIYEGEVQSYRKEDRTPVTEADFAAEKVLIAGLKEYEYPILSEETEDDLSRLEEERIWIIDPLDGTQDFLNRTGEFSIMVGLAHRGEPVLGVVYKPVDGKVYVARRGEGAYLREPGKSARKLGVSSTSSLAEAHFIFSRHHVGEIEKKFTRDNKVRSVTQMGSTGVKLGYIAEGRADGYFTMSNKTSQWDTCAPEIILREAGGKVTDGQGKKFTYNRREVRNLHGIIASNGRIHTQILENLNQKQNNPG